MTFFNHMAVFNRMTNFNHMTFGNVCYRVKNFQSEI